MNKEMLYRPVTIFLCLHFWRKEWWRKSTCNQCRNWIRALIKGNYDIEKVNEAYKEGYRDGYAHKERHNKK
jgi:hypothetical protein